VEELGLSDVVRWWDHPSREEYERAFAESAVAVIPYVSGSPIFAASQALAHGTPVVGTRLPEMVEYLGPLARYVEPGSPVQLAYAVDTLLASAAERRELAERMLERARVSLDWPVVARRTLHIYRGEEPLLDPDPWPKAEAVAV